MRKFSLPLASIAVALWCSACTEVTFPTHQPKDVKPLVEMPKELRGKYVTPEGDSADIQDTLIIDATQYRFTSSAKKADHSWLDNAQLSDSLIVKKYKGYYFFNFKEKDQWLLRVVKLESGGDLSFRMFAIDGTGKDKLLWELEQEIPVETIQIDSNEKYYRIDPTPKKLLQLVKKKKYWEESKLKRVK
jgi:hypothetical protein